MFTILYVDDEPELLVLCRTFLHGTHLHHPRSPAAMR